MIHYVDEQGRTKQYTDEEFKAIAAKVIDRQIRAFSVGAFLAGIGAGVVLSWALALLDAIK